MTSLVVHQLASIILIIVCIGIYYNSLTNEFAFDDYLAIVNNKDVQYGSTGPDHFSNYSVLWRDDIWGKDLQAIDSHRSYRPLLTTIFKFIVQLYGLNATIFRIVSISFHCCATISVYYLSRLTFRNDALAFGASLLFASHPVHIESVAAVVNMAEAASLTLSILAYLLYYNLSAQNYKQSDNSKARTVRTNGSHMGYFFRILKQIFCIGCWFGLVISSILFKETGITVCGIMIASSGISLLLTLKSSYINYTVQVKTIQYKNEMSLIDKINKQKPDAQKIIHNSVVEKELKEPYLIQMLFNSFLNWFSYHFFWLLSAVVAVLLYSLFRVALLTPNGPIIKFLETLQNWNKIYISGNLIKELNLVSNKFFEIGLKTRIIEGVNFLNPRGILGFIGSLGNLGQSVSSSYLGESKLIRKAENPFSFLVGEEKVLSMMVRNVLCWN